MSGRLIGRDQYGTEYGPLDPKRPRASLLEALGARTAVPMYRDTAAGTRRVGYVVSEPREAGRGHGQLWVSFYTVTPWEVAR